MSASGPTDPLGMEDRRSGDEPPLAMRLLATGVPLSLLLDLVSPGGPDSERIAAIERAWAC